MGPVFDPFQNKRQKMCISATVILEMDYLNLLV